VKKKKTHPLILPDDLPHTVAFVKWAQKHKLPVRRTSPFQYKIGPWNYYPTKQTFNSDDKPEVKLKGFGLLKQHVLDWRDNCVSLDDD